jgi:ferrochelatase
LHRTLRDLAAEKVRDVCIVPVSFVSDHVETLGEIDHEAREEAASLGLGQFEMTAGLNDSPKFIEALVHLVMKAAMRESFVLPTRENVAAQLMAAD